MLVVGQERSLVVVAECSVGGWEAADGASAPAAGCRVCPLLRDGSHSADIVFGLRECGVPRTPTAERLAKSDGR